MLGSGATFIRVLLLSHCAVFVCGDGNREYGIVEPKSSKNLDGVKLASVGSWALG